MSIKDPDTSPASQEYQTPKRRRIQDDSEDSSEEDCHSDEQTQTKFHTSQELESRQSSESCRRQSLSSGNSSPYQTCSRSRSSKSRTPGLSSSSHASSPSGPQSRRLNFQPKFTLKGHKGPVSQVRFSPDGRWIASCSADATIKIWDTTDGSHIRTIRGHLAGISTISWSPDSKTIASGSDDKTIRLWHRTTGKPYPVPLLGHHNYVYSVSFSPKGNMLASGSYDEAVFLWDLRARKNLRSLPAHSDPVSSVDFIHDGTLVCSCSTDGLIRVWETVSGQCLRTLVHEDNAPVTNVCFSPNGRYILAWTLDSCIRLWDYVSGTCKKTYQGHINKKYSLGGAFSVSGSDSYIVSGSEDGNLVFWDVKTKEELQRVSGHDGVVCWIDTCTETGMIVSGGLDGNVRIWIDINNVEDPVNGMLELQLRHREEDSKDLNLDVDSDSNCETPRQDASGDEDPIAGENPEKMEFD